MAETESLKQQLEEMRVLIEKMNNTQQQTQNQIHQQPYHQNQIQQQTYQPLMFQYPYQQYQFNPNSPNFTNRGGRSGRFRGGRRGRGGRGNDNGRERKYCWTHGLCSHNGRECSNPAQGHQQDATLENRMGGNTRNVNA